MKKTITAISSLIACACACASYAAEATVVAAPAAPAAAPAATAPAAQPEAKAINTLADEEVCAKVLDKFSASLTLGFESEYVFRGQALAGASLNPQIDAAYDLSHGFAAYAGVWANTPTKAGVSDEIDFYAGITYEIKNFTFDLGYTAYTYTDNAVDPNSHEMKFAVSYDTVDFLGNFNVSPTAAAYYDFTLGVYTLEAGATYSAPVTKWIADRNWGTIDLAAVYGWTTTATSGGYSYFAASADAVVAINEYCTLSVGVRYAYNNDYTELESTASRVWFGTKASIGF